MVYCPQDPNSPQLYVVKRKNVEEYETGSHSYVGPKLYLIGNAKSIAKKNNKWLQETEEETIEYYTRVYLPTSVSYKFYVENYGLAWLEDAIIARTKDAKEEFAKGPWVVAPAVVSSGVSID